MAGGTNPRDPRRNAVIKELVAKFLGKIRDQVQKLGKSYEKILRELYANNPQKLQEELAKLAKLIEELKKLGINPNDYFEPQ